MGRLAEEEPLLDVREVDQVVELGGGEAVALPDRLGQRPFRVRLDLLERVDGVRDLRGDGLLEAASLGLLAELLL